MRDTYSFANADRIFGQEYHGRFLIELLQNAADASRKLGSSRVAIRVAADRRALLVANKGDSMTAEVVLKSLGQIGQSKKEKGEDIGHKGIGFKSVLELSLTPEIYSGLRELNPTLSVGFDPEKAREVIREASHDDWEKWDKEVRGSDDPLASIPLLRFPYWIEDLPPDVAELGREFDTVVRLPFDKRFTERLKLDEKGWVEAVRKSLRDVSDRIFLLLGRFDEVRIEDLHAGTEEVIKREMDEGPVKIGGGAKREDVRVMRNEHLSSRWRLFRRRLEGRPNLEEVAVGVRIGDEPDGAKVLSAMDNASAADDSASAPFHLFFPTKMNSGLPFLLHAYFEVNAARTGFYDGSESHNKAMLDELAKLVKSAVEDIVHRGNLDLASLVNLVAKAGDDIHDGAGEFRSNVLHLLDDVAWIPLKDGHEGRWSDSPKNVLATNSEMESDALDHVLVERIGGTFPSWYVKGQTDLALPEAGLEDQALRLVGSRHSDGPRLWETIEKLCLPGDNPPWEGEAADEGFLKLISLFESLNAKDHNETKALLGKLSGNPKSRLIPVVGEEKPRKFLQIQDSSESGPGRRSMRVMARVRSSSGGDLVPPDDLGVAFLHDGLFSSVEEVSNASRLGVRPFTVDAVLDRLGGIEASEGNEADLVRFLWKFLAGERQSPFGTRQSAETAATFDPSEWFWCDPGTIWKDETARDRQRRIRNLSSVLLPCRDGEWRRAGRIAFGKDWAEWLERISGENHPEATEKRIAAYRAMEKLSPGSEHLLANPDEVLPLLGGEVFENIASKADRGKSDVELGESDMEPDEGRKNAERHAFLLRLGVWEVPPIEAYENRERGRSKFPWTGKTADKQRKFIEENGGWRFDLGGLSGDRHHEVYLAEDHRFVWPLQEMAHRDGPALVECLRRGAELYRKRMDALVFCPGCGRHTTLRKSVEGDGFPSSLATALRSEPWIPCTLYDEGSKIFTEPEAAWWNSEPPSGDALKQSPWRFIPHCGPNHGVDENLRRLAGVSTFKEASADAVERLLKDLRERFESGRLPGRSLSSSVARQAFVGAHREAYESLAKLASEVEAKEIAKRRGMLCQIGENLEYRTPGKARHDDGQFASYTHRFDGKVPFVVLRKDRGPVADALGVSRFQLNLTRSGGDGGWDDVTDEVPDIHADRIPELLAIVAHHSLGAQTLEPSGNEFKTRASRLQNLRIIRLDDLVVDVVVEGMEVEPIKIGARSSGDLFLDNSNPSLPRLFHDFSGDRWRDRLRQKISPHFAAILESPTYAHTFMAFLQSDEADREEFLHHELGISESDVDAIAKRIGAARKEEKKRNIQWFRAILEARGHDPSSLDDEKSNLRDENIALELENSGLPEHVAHRLVDIGGGEEARRYPGEGSALWMLREAGTDLRKLDEILGDDRLDIRVAKNYFWAWIRVNERRLTAVLAKGKSSDEETKKTIREMKPPDKLLFELAPEKSAILAPVVDALENAGFSADSHALVENSAEELARVGGFGSVKELDAKVELLLDERESARELRSRASEWRRGIHILAVLANIGENETPAHIRDMDEMVSSKLPGNPSSPSDLRSSLDEQNLFDEWFGGYAALTARLRESLTDSINATVPGHEILMGWAEDDGVAVSRLEAVKRALAKPRSARVRTLKEHVKLLDGMRPEKPSFIPLPTPDEPTTTEPTPLPVEDEEGEKPVIPGERPGGPRLVSSGKVGEDFDRRKRELGDKGERWALASEVDALMKLDKEAREEAIEKISDFIRRWFSGPHAATMLGRGEDARDPRLDEDDSYEALSDFLHASRHDDGFGFDMIGFIEGRPMCLEVKSSADETDERFHLSHREWSEAKELRGNYAILVVRRSRSAGLPAGMHLLPDPVKLVENKLLDIKPDGYLIAYGIKES